MPWGIRYLESEHCAVIRFEGEIGLSEMLKSVEAVFLSPFINQPGLIGLSDWRKARAMLSYEEWRQYEHLLSTRWAEPRSHFRRWAYLTTNALDTANGFLHLHKSDARFTRQIFSTLEAASEYLGVDLAPHCGELDQSLSEESA